MEQDCQTTAKSLTYLAFTNSLRYSRRVNGACAHYVTVSNFQWKPFWLATQRDPQNDWTATQNRVNCMTYSHRPHHHSFPLWSMHQATPWPRRATQKNLSSFFVRQASMSASDGVLPNILTAPVTDSQTLTELSVSLQDVQRALHGLDARKAPGSDGNPTRLLVVLANEIAPCAHHIFSLSLRTATVPTCTEWKSATVHPIYQERGSKQVATNYHCAYTV